jgi:toxin ParE1/3/4
VVKIIGIKWSTSPEQVVKMDRNLQQADKYYNLLLESCQEIANNPDLGRKYDGINSDLFGLKSFRHIIFYRILKDKPIEITRILHGKMDLKNRITE